MAILFSVGIVLFAIPVNAEQDKDPSAVLTNISTIREASTQADAERNASQYAPSDVKAADGAEKSAGMKKGKLSRKKIIALSFFAVVFAFVVVNIMSVGHNARVCTRCGYIGHMKAVTLAETSFLNSLLKTMVTVFPVLLNYFAERGRFVCPVCRRTSTNVTMRRKFKDVNS